MNATQEKPAAAEQPAEQEGQLTREEHKIVSAQLMDRITADVFFSKLAEFNIVPRNQREMEQLLNIGLNIDKLSQHPSVKQAEAQRKGPDFLGFANDRIVEQLEKLGMTPPPADADEEAINKLAAIYTLEPVVQEAVLSVYSE